MMCVGVAIHSRLSTYAVYKGSDVWFRYDIKG